MLAEACGEKRMGGGASREGAAGSSKAEDARFRRSRGAPLLVTSSQHSEESATEPAPRRLRLLCLHGYGANNDISALQLRHLQLEERLNVACDLIEASTLEVRPRYSCARATAAPPTTAFRPFFLSSPLRTISNRSPATHRRAGTRPISRARALQ